MKVQNNNKSSNIETLEKDKSDDKTVFGVKNNKEKVSILKDGMAKVPKKSNTIMNERSSDAK